MIEARSKDGKELDPVLIRSKRMKLLIQWRWNEWNEHPVIILSTLYFGALEDYGVILIPEGLIECLGAALPYMKLATVILDETMC